ncbi:SDR family NAD(P)-dependent oxidoreductase [Ciceribacter sp. RN22]|uniref:SDR family NAD(P)-dependent oxidoreductase n=1 Tax=Ciceribacter sp. RN22 TaxID=2954932 RepID=UPI002092DE3B|nr:SDR family oxidoreductase [Ciceribacter sp. RN22]MCO6179867.1 SDR family oxidoreductase [Ciceribacter sp. RN22]
MKGMFSDRTVVITGASRGIGLGIARAFHREGARLHLIADDPAVHARADELGATAAQADIADGASVDAALKDVATIDVLINNAGLERLTPLGDPSPEAFATFRRIIDINIAGTALVTRRALQSMSSGGAIVNTASIWGRVAEAQFDAYVASKHAIIGLTKTWAKELGPRNIRVNAVCPGWVRTEASMRSLGLMASAQGVSEDSLLEDIVSGQALPGLMEPDDMGEIYLFLASDKAKNITGQSIGADRGEVPW